MKITGVTSEVFEWERPGIWNGGHFYGPGRLHKVTVTTDEGVTGYSWNGGTAAERPMEFFPLYVNYSVRCSLAGTLWTPAASPSIWARS